MTTAMGRRASVWMIAVAVSSLCAGFAVPADREQQAEPAADARFFAVSYVEVMPSARTAALAAFKQYRERSKKQDDRVRFELFEQVGRPAHFAIVETWPEQKAFDAGAASIRQQLLDGLQSVRVSGFDQRPYKALAVDSQPGGSIGGTVSVVSHVDVAPDPRVAGILKRLAEASRHDPGNLRFDVLQHTMRANHFTVIETWKSQRALDEHAAAAHTKQYRDELQPMTGSPLDERVYRQLEY